MKETPEPFDIETHRCTDEELGLLEFSDSSSSKFYPHSESSQAALTNIEDRSIGFYCFDQDKIQLMNDITSPEAYRLSIYFDIPLEFCQNKWEDAVDMSCTPGVEYDS